MEQNQFKRREFNELDFWNPSTWFGAPSVAPPAFNGVSQDEKSAGLPGWKTSTDTSFNSSLKSNFVSPFTKVEKSVVNNVKKVENTIENIAETAEKDLKMISTESIACFYSENKGTYIHTNDNRDYLIDSTLDELEKELEPRTFFRVSRKFYVNINAIKDMVSYANSRLQIKLNSYNNQEVIVSRERVRDFKDWIE